MFKRKIYVALFTSIFAVIYLNIMEPVPYQDGGILLGIAVYSLYIVPTVFIYGIISSVIADKLSVKTKEFQEVKSLGVHIFFGLLFIISYSIFYEYKPFATFNFIEVVTHPIPALCFVLSVVFFMIDRFLRNWDKSREIVYS